MGYNIWAKEYNHFKKQTDIKHASNKCPTVATSDTMSDEDYNQLTGFHHDDSLYTDYKPQKQYRKHTKNYEKLFTINKNQTFLTFNKDGTYNISGKLSQSDKAIIDDHTGLFPTGLTLTLTEVFKKIES